MAITNDTMVVVKNMTKSRVFMQFQTVAGGEFKRLLQPHAEVPIKYGDLQVAMYEYGISNAFSEGMLCIVRPDEALEEIEVNFDKEAAKVQVEKVKTYEEILSGTENGAIMALIRDSANNQVLKDQIISFCVSKKLSQPIVVSSMKTYYNYDILEAIKVTSTNE